MTIFSAHFYTRREAAAILRCSEKTISRYIREGELKHCVYRGKAWLIPQESLIEFCNNHNTHRESETLISFKEVAIKQIRRRPRVGDMRKTFYMVVTQLWTEGGLQPSSIRRARE